MSNDSIDSKSVILNVSEDSDAKLEALFSVVLGPGDTKQSRQDGLPASLYKEPDNTEAHKIALGPSIQIPPGPYNVPRGNHGKHLSLPADIGRYSHSSNLDLHGMPLPPGWEFGKTVQGHTYFIK